MTRVFALLALIAVAVAKLQVPWVPADLPQDADIDPSEWVQPNFAPRQFATLEEAKGRRPPPPVAVVDAWSAPDPFHPRSRVQAFHKTTPAGGVLLDIPPRRMWGWTEGNGYCGETSLQSAGIYNGNYISSELVRYADGNEELLIGINDVKAAKALHFEHEAWDFESAKNPQEAGFKKWMKNHLDNGFLVTAGFYLRMKSGGDKDYDHIMPLIGAFLFLCARVVDCVRHFLFSLSLLAHPRLTMCEPARHPCRLDQGTRLIPKGN